MPTLPSGAARASALDALPHCGGSLLAAAKAANAAYRQCFDEYRAGTRADDSDHDSDTVRPHVYPETGLRYSA